MPGGVNYHHHEIYSFVALSVVSSVFQVVRCLRFYNLFLVIFKNKDPYDDISFFRRFVNSQIPKRGENLLGRIFTARDLVSSKRT